MQGTVGDVLRLGLRGRVELLWRCSAIFVALGPLSLVRRVCAIQVHLVEWVMSVDSEVVVGR